MMPRRARSPRSAQRAGLTQYLSSMAAGVVLLQTQLAARSPVGRLVDSIEIADHVTIAATSQISHSAPETGSYSSGTLVQPKAQ